MDDIALSQGVRRNLLAMQQTVELMDRTQIRIATGKKITSALDNPTSFFIAAKLENRASDLSRLLDNMSLAIKTLEATDEGIQGLKKLVETAQATAATALQDATGGTPVLLSALSGLTNSSTFGAAGFQNGNTLTVTYGTGSSAVSQQIPVNAGGLATITGTKDSRGYTNGGSLIDFTFSVGGTNYTINLFGGDGVQTIVDTINGPLPFDWD